MYSNVNLEMEEKATERAEAQSQKGTRVQSNN
jgi:hypothetical protein